MTARKFYAGLVFLAALTALEIVSGIQDCLFKRVRPHKPWLHRTEP